MKLRTILCEDDKLSLGRLSFWIVFLMTCVFWSLSIPVPPTMEWFFSVLVTYNLSKKPLEIYARYVDGKFSVDNTKK